MVKKISEFKLKFTDNPFFQQLSNHIKMCTVMFNVSEAKYGWFLYLITDLSCKSLDLQFSALVT